MAVLGEVLEEVEDCCVVVRWFSKNVGEVRVESVVAKCEVDVIVLSGVLQLSELRWILRRK